MLCFKKAVRVLRLSRCRARPLRSTEANETGKKVAIRIVKLFGLRKQRQAHPIRVIIDATSTTDDKTKSRWTRALRYAWRERKTWTDLKMFLRENGGPAGCAARFAAVHPKARYPGCIVYRCPGTGRPYLIVDKTPVGARQATTG
jgi:hypothetical protein